MGIGKEQRDFLGRWQAGAQESNAYILSAKQAVLTIQTKVNRLVCEGHENLTEGEIIGDLQRYARDRGVRLRDDPEKETGWEEGSLHQVPFVGDSNGKPGGR